MELQKHLWYSYVEVIVSHKLSSKMKENNPIKYHIHPSVFYRSFTESTVVYLTSGQRVFTFNETVGDILDCFKEPCSVEQAVKKLLGVYDVPDEVEFEKEISEFVSQLVEKGILVEEYHQVEVLHNLESEVSSQFDSGEQLYSVLIELTYKCNERCRHCYIVDEHRQEMSFEKVCEILDELAEMKTFNIIFTGGELFTRKDAFEILEYAYSKRFVVDIFTNGNLIDGNDYIRLKSVWPRCVHFSLYSHIPEKHDAITRVPGSFDKTLKSIRSCVTIGIPVNIKTPIFEETMDDVSGIVALANEIGCSVEMGRNITPKKDGDLAPVQMKILSEKDEESVVDTIYQLITTLDNAPAQSKVPDKLCGAGERSLSINPYGEVFPCSMLQICIGDVNKQSIREIWEHSEKLKEWRQMNRRSLRKGCDGCKLADECVFCPGEAMMRTGDPLSMYNEACETSAFAAKRRMKGGGDPS